MNTNNGGSSSFNSATPTFDNLLLQSLMSGLHLRPPNLQAPPPFSALEDILFSDLLRNLSESDTDTDIENPSSSSSKTQLAREESKLEKEIVRTILSGEIEDLKPNSGQAIAFGEHHICVAFQQENGSDYRVWEWHGHIMLFDEENGYTPEYIYGNYFERVSVGMSKMQKKNTKNDDDKELNVGLKELIECGESGSGRILHRNLNTNSGSSRI